MTVLLAVLIFLAGAASMAVLAGVLFYGAALTFGDITDTVE